MNLSRRAFLKVIGVTTAVASAPILFATGREYIPKNNEKDIGLIREIIGYDIYADEMIISHGIRTSKFQIEISSELNKPRDMDERTEKRKIALEIIIEEMNKRGLTVSDLQPLSLPPRSRGLKARFIKSEHG